MNSKTQRNIHRLTRTRKMSTKVCCFGVCEGKTWDEAKEFIIKKHDLDYWMSWVDRVKWRWEDSGHINIKMKKENKKLKETVAHMEKRYEAVEKRYEAVVKDNVKLHKDIKEIKKRRHHIWVPWSVWMVVCWISSVVGYLLVCKWRRM